jgi:hypothetical protein
LQLTKRLIQALGVLGFATAISFFAGCGGGDGGDGGGGGGGGGGSVANSAPVTVNSGGYNVPNIPMVSVTICAPGSTTNCQTIDNVQVDTGSFGLRVVGSVISPGVLSLLEQSNINGVPLNECGLFVDGYTWGSVRKADVHIAGETASSLPIQIIGDQGSVPVPSDCSGIGSAENTASELGANGILGIGVAPYDCPSCTNTANPIPGAYYACNGTSCQATGVPLGQQVANPVTKFATDNNGVILTLPALGDGGAASVAGTLTFGIGTQSNNKLSGVAQFTTDDSGTVLGTLAGAPINPVFFDSGSNAYFFPGAAPNMPACNSTSTAPGFYCPASQTSVAVTVQNHDGSGNIGSLSINVANASSLFESGNFAFNNLGGPISNMLDLGLPFFFGRSVYYGIDQTLLGGSGRPYVAF